MPRTTANITYNNFIRGLITEATEINWPDNASVDEDNCIIYRKGNRSRRLGIDWEESSQVLTDTITQTKTQNGSISKTFSWLNAGEVSGENILVQYLDGALYFFDLNDASQSNNTRFSSININARRVDASEEITDISFASGKGFLFVVGSNIRPTIIVYINSTTLVPYYLDFLIRDFDGVDDSLDVDEEPTSLSKFHEYNLKNQGWVPPATGVASPITTYFTAHSRYPANSQQWWVAKDSNENFDASSLTKTFFGKTEAPKGHYLLDPFNKDRSTASGVSGLTTETEDTRPNSVSFFAARVWYAMHSKVWFSQVLKNQDNAAWCYQSGDPTSEEFSAIVDTDGGELDIPAARNICHLEPFFSGILAFAENGVWYISGTEGVFTPTSISVRQVATSGLIAKESVVSANNSVMWWSEVGIISLSQTDNLDSFRQVNITESTIQSYYNDTIPTARRQYARGRFDPSRNTVLWMWGTNDLTPKYGYNKFLFLDLGTGAFYPWTISGDEETGPIIFDAYLLPDPVQIQHPVDNYYTYLKYAVYEETGASYRTRFAQFDDDTFADWATYETSTGYAYESFIETGYEILDDTMREKQIRYLFVHMGDPATLYVTDGTGSYELDFVSSLSCQTKFGWSSKASSNRWSPSFEVYKPQRLQFVDPSSITYEKPFNVSTTKNRVRGHGKSLQFRFSNSAIGQTFNLLGWAASVDGVTTV